MPGDEQALRGQLALCPRDYRTADAKVGCQFRQYREPVASSHARDERPKLPLGVLAG